MLVVYTKRMSFFYNEINALYYMVIFFVNAGIAILVCKLYTVGCCCRGIIPGGMTELQCTVK